MIPAHKTNEDAKENKMCDALIFFLQKRSATTS